MSVWETEIFSADAAIDLLEELAELELEDRESAVIDACQIASADTAQDDDITAGLAAAVLAAIWSGAPYAGHDLVDEYPLIREGRDLDPSEELSEAAAAVFDAHTESLSESDQDILRDYVDAVG